MRIKKIGIILAVCMIAIVMVTGMAWAKKKAPSMDKWKPAFDSSTAKYRCIVSNVSHPVLMGTHAGFALRDELWKRTNGQIYIDYKPLCMLGGEVEVLNQLQMGAIQGMGVSSIASTNLGPRFGLVNLPFLLDSFEKLDKFANSGQLFDHFMNAMGHQGITGVDISSYGNYGWATTVPVKTLADMKKIKIRIGEASVNKLTYKAWGINPVVMPWPDVPVALKQGVITGLDHTINVCCVSKKFEVAKYYTQINYAQGLFIWIFNTRWLNKLPADLEKIFIETVHDVCKEYRKLDQQQEKDMIALSMEKYGVTFFTLPEGDMNILKKEANVVHDEFAPEINKLYKGDKYRPANYLAEVQAFIGYKP